MIKVIVELNEDKILAQGEHKVSDVYKTIDNIFLRNNLILGEKGEYIEAGTKDDYSNFGIVITTLAEQDWFLEYVQKWIWWENEDEDDPNDIYTEDILEALKDFKKNVNRYGK